MTNEITKQTFRAIEEALIEKGENATAQDAVAILTRKKIQPLSEEETTHLLHTLKQITRYKRTGNVIHAAREIIKFRSDVQTTLDAITNRLARSSPRPAPSVPRQGKKIPVSVAERLETVFNNPGFDAKINTAMEKLTTSLRNVLYNTPTKDPVELRIREAMKKDPALQTRALKFLERRKGVTDQSERQRRRARGNKPKKPTRRNPRRRPGT